MLIGRIGECVSWWIGRQTAAILALLSRYVFETGPYGRGHVVLQAETECGPCREDAACPEHKCRTAVRPDLVLNLLTGRPVGPGPEHRVYTSCFVEDRMVYRPLHRVPATTEDVIGLLTWGSAGAFLEEPPGRLPSLAGALQFLVEHYAVNPPLLAAVHERLDRAVPTTLSAPDRDRLLGILHKGWTRLQRMYDEMHDEMHHEHAGEEPFRPATAAA